MSGRLDRPGKEERTRLTDGGIEEGKMKGK